MFVCNKCGGTYATVGVCPKCGTADGKTIYEEPKAVSAPPKPPKAVTGEPKTPATAVAETRFCVQCGTKMAASDAVCANCGAPNLAYVEPPEEIVSEPEPEPVKTVFCAYCGNVFPVTEAVCTECGAQNLAYEEPPEPPRSVFCVSCGATITVLDATCTACGAQNLAYEGPAEPSRREQPKSEPKQAEAEEKTVVCEYCGAKVAEGAAVCMSCGCPPTKAVGEQVAEQAATPVSEPPTQPSSKKWLVPVIVAAAVVLVVAIVVILAVVVPNARRENVLKQLKGETFTFRDYGSSSTEKTLKFVGDNTIKEHWYTDYTYIDDFEADFSWSYTLEEEDGELYVVITDSARYRVDMEDDKVEGLFDAESGEYYELD